MMNVVANGSIVLDSLDYNHRLSQGIAFYKDPTYAKSYEDIKQLSQTGSFTRVKKTSSILVTNQKPFGFTFPYCLNLPSMKQLMSSIFSYPYGILCLTA